MKDLMIDIETLGNTSDAVCIQLAGVFFDRDTKETGAAFSEKITRESCIKLGFKEDESTLKWWSEQNQDIFKELTTGGRDVIPVMKQFNNFIRSYDKHGKETKIWSHATFDFVIIQNYMKKSGAGYMSYKNAMDIRTLVALSGINLDTYDWSKKTHNALDDCLFQIDYCCDAIKRITEACPIYYL